MNATDTAARRERMFGMPSLALAVVATVLSLVFGYPWNGLALAAALVSAAVHTFIFIVWCLRP